MVAYSLRNHTAVSVIDGFDQVLLCDEGLLEESSTIDYSLKGYWAARQLPMNPRCHVLTENFSDDLALKRNQLISAQGLLLAIWDSHGGRNDGSHRLPVDYVLVSGKQKPDLKQILETYRVGTLLIDGSVPDYLAKEWNQQAEMLHVPCRSLRDGFFVL